jgi:hypothetical protein
VSTAGQWLDKHISVAKNTHTQEKNRWKLCSLCSPYQSYITKTNRTSRPVRVPREKNTVIGPWGPKPRMTVPVKTGSKLPDQASQS